MNASKNETAGGAGKTGAMIADIMQSGAMSDADLRALRNGALGEGAVSRADAEALFALDRAGSEKPEGWVALFVETITDHAVWQSRPTGVVSPEQAQWLIDQADRTKSVNALAILVNVLAEADRVPQWLPAAVRGRAAAGWPGVNEALEASQREARAAA